MRLPALLLLLCAAPPVAAQPKQLPPELVAPTDALSPADERKAFTLPPGFDAQLVASEPDIQKPMQMAFDAKGRMWVTTSYHYPFAAPLGKGTDKVFVLSDFDPATGKAKKVQTFTSDLNIPIGILPLPDCKSVIVSSVGEIRKYTDADCDGKADGPPEVLFTGFGYRDTHGMYNSYTLMPDGWVYSCHGFANDSTVKGKDGHEVKMHSGHTFRFRPDGSRIEVYSRGQVNPFGMTVDPWFNLYTADCHSKPITQVIPGAYYDSFGKPHDGLGFGPHVTRHDHGSTGLCGLSWYAADQFPKDYVGRMFVGNVVTNRINFDTIEWKGSSPLAKELPDFMTSSDRWFRPVDIKLGPDGTLYVADFYNKIIGHYEVPLTYPGRDHDHGRIWRIVWKGKGEPGASATGVPAPKFAYPDLTTAKGEVIDELLGHPNLMVRMQATNAAIHRKEDMRAREGPNEVYKVHRLWVDEMRSCMYGNGGEGPRANHGNDEPLLAAHQYKIERAVEELLRERKSRPVMARKAPDLAKADPHIARAAAEMMAGSPKANYVPALLTVLKECGPDDTHLRQTARIALRNCLRDDPKAWPGEYDAIYADMALAIPNEKAAAYLQAHIVGGSLAGAKLVAAAEHVGRYGAAESDDKLIEALTKAWRAELPPGDALLSAFKGLQARGRQLAPGSVRLVLDVAQRNVIGASFVDAKATATEVTSIIPALRVLAALPGIAGRGANAELDRMTRVKLKEYITGPRAPLEVRTASADVLLRFTPDDALEALRIHLAKPDIPESVRAGLLLTLASSGVKDARLDARDSLKDSPYRSAVAVGTALAGAPGGAQDLLDAVKMGKAPARLLQEKAIVERLRTAGIPDLDKQLAALTKGLPPLDARLADLIKKRSVAFASAKPNKEEGAKLFVKHCAACHRIGDNGGKIAPQLDGIGLRGLERLLEDTLDPNRNVDQAFRARVILTKDEKTITGLMLRVEGEVLVVADGEGKELRIPTKDIASNRETMLSPMPANFGDVVPEGDFAHLIAYLLDQKTAVAKKE